MAPVRSPTVSADPSNPTRPVLDRGTAVVTMELERGVVGDLATLDALERVLGADLWGAQIKE